MDSQVASTWISWNLSIKDDETILPATPNISSPHPHSLWLQAAGAASVQLHVVQQGAHKTVCHPERQSYQNHKGKETSYYDLKGITMIVHAPGA